MENLHFQKLKKNKKEHNLKHLKREIHTMEFNRDTKVYILVLVLLTTNFILIGSMSLAELKDDLQNESSLKKRQLSKISFTNNTIGLFSWQHGTGW